MAFNIIFTCYLVGIAIGNLYYEKELRIRIARFIVDKVAAVLNTNIYFEQSIFFPPMVSFPEPTIYTSDLKRFKVNKEFQLDGDMMAVRHYDHTSEAMRRYMRNQFCKIAGDEVSRFLADNPEYIRQFSREDNPFSRSPHLLYEFEFWLDDPKSKKPSS